MKVAITSRTGKAKQFSIERAHVIGFLVLAIAVIAGSMAGGHLLSPEKEMVIISESKVEPKVLYIQVEPPKLLAEFEQVLAEQRNKLATLNEQSQNQLRALSRRLGQMQAHVMRIDALGQRVVGMAKLNDGEFDFESTPAQGGPMADDDVIQKQSVADFLTSLNTLETHMEDRYQQLQMLESWVMKSELEKQTEPSRRPVNTGWLSSKFGARRDPFDGNVRYHYGVDFASPHGSDVVAVGAGRIKHVEDRRGYGLIVEVDHGNNFVTRYAHNSAVTVEEGDMVTRGQVIAKVGQTGRSTGPHVHFEVIYDGVKVDPAQYMSLEDASTKRR